MSQITVPSHGPVPAKILIIGEHPSVEDERKMRLFSGSSGNEFMKMLQEAGHLTTEIRYTSLLRSRPYNSQMKYVWTKDSAEAKACIPGAKKIDGAYYVKDFYERVKHILPEIEACNPNVIIPLGDAALWYLTQENSVSKWRGSIMQFDNALGERPYKLIPTYTPSQIMRMWEWRAFAVRDLERARVESEFPEIRTPDYQLKIRPTFEEVKTLLNSFYYKATYTKGPIRLVADIETIARHIACIGIAWSETEAMCIPFMDAKHSHYYTLEEETEIIWGLKRVLTHPKIEVEWQNGVYDAQHIIRHWGFRPKISFDTMLAQHSIFPGIPKDLGFLASLYCKYYVYWKDELTDYKSLPKDLDQFWLYNAKDCVNTYEIAGTLRPLVKQLGFQDQCDFVHQTNGHLLTMMVRGSNIDKNEKNRLMLALQPEIQKREEEINYLVSGELNISSPKQMKELFYDQLQMKVVPHKKTHKPTTDGQALEIFGQREPILKPLVHLIEEARSIGVFLSTFVMMQLDKDGRMRCSFNAAGTETYRLSSSKNAFGSGGNLQNWPKGTEDEDVLPGQFIFPNVRRMVIPDRGYEQFDVDLAGADAQVVAWEAEDDDLKAKFRSGAKIHALNAKDIYGNDAGPDGKKAPYYKRAKMGCHLTNYGGKPPTLSKALGMTIHESELFQRRWFQMHPGIKTWHLEVENSLMTTRSVRNKFGFRRFYFDRIEGLLPQALAWIPQSTIAIVSLKGLCNIAESGSSMELLLQVHDSIVGQYPKDHRYINLPILKKCLTVPVPYSDPLIISTSIDLSTTSWGDLKTYTWKELGVE
jgi:DNA polymerase I-like protein with 3'-5' exonuclease and polymerase domains/uracil-DNA glycosylase